MMKRVASRGGYVDEDSIEEYVICTVHALGL